MNKKAIIYFFRVPSLGNGQTRLRNFLSLEEIQSMSQYLVKKNYEILSQVDADLYLCIPADDSLEDLQDVLEYDPAAIIFQDGKDLGERMYRAFEKLEAQAYDKILLSGSDLYNLNSNLIEDLFDQLNSHDMVLSPSLDGGYGVIGMKKPLKEAFSIGAYSHEHVTEDTLQAVQAAGYSATRVGEVLDIDDRDDIAKALSGDSQARFHSQGEYNANFLIEDGKKLLRIALGSQLHLGKQQIAYEYHALKGLQESGSVVEVYDLVEETDLIGKGFLTQEYVEGRPLNYETDMEIAAELLAKIHAVDPDKLPHLIPAKKPFQVMYDEFLTMFSRYQGWEKRDRKVESIISAMLEDLKSYNLSSPIQNSCVINTELNSGNFVINSKARSYIVDWEKPLIGEREQDLGHFLAPTTTLWKTDVVLDFDLVEQFVKNYNQYATCSVNLPKLIQYLQFTCLRGISWCSMAYVDYIESGKSRTHSQSFKVIKKFIQVPFLKQIQAYIETCRSQLPY